MVRSFPVTHRCDAIGLCHSSNVRLRKNVGAGSMKSRYQEGFGGRINLIRIVNIAAQARADVVTFLIADELRPDVETKMICTAC